MKIRVVVAEDDILTREGVVALLRTQSNIEVVGTADSFDSALSEVETHEPNVLVTDIRMPPSHTDEGIRIALRLETERPRLGVVILSQYEDPEYAVRLLESGATGRAYLLKERVSDVSQLSTVVAAVADGGSHVDPKVIRRLVSLKSGSKSPLDWLTERELDVLAMIAEGRDNRAIAQLLSINVRSVEKHINSIFAKLGLAENQGISKRVAAVLIYLESN